jgi:hypothetical protein
MLLDIFRIYKLSRIIRTLPLYGGPSTLTASMGLLRQLTPAATDVLKLFKGFRGLDEVEKTSTGCG